MKHSTPKHTNTSHETKEPLREAKNDIVELICLLDAGMITISRFKFTLEKVKSGITKAMKAAERPTVHFKHRRAA